jgi:hypothetical protein
VAEIVPSDIALWKPFTGKGTTLFRRDIVCVHTMVGSLAGSYSWASGAGRSYWHFGVSGTGECWQCQDLRYQSAANLEGNPYVIPIENADHGPGFEPWSGRCGDVPPFTQAQVNKLVQLIAWLCRRYAIPPEFIPDTRAGRRGVAWHRQGIPGWPEWQGGLLWSSSTGKCCPDWRRIAQAKLEIMPRVRELVYGTPPPPPLPLPVKDDRMQLIRNTQNPTIYLLYDGKLFYVPSNADRKAWLTGDVKESIVSPEQLTVLKAGCPVVTAPPT